MLHVCMGYDDDTTQGVLTVQGVPTVAMSLGNLSECTFDFLDTCKEILGNCIQLLPGSYHITFQIPKVRLDYKLKKHKPLQSKYDSDDLLILQAPEARPLVQPFLHRIGMTPFSLQFSVLIISFVSVPHE